MKELFNEVASSIFKPVSRLFISPVQRNSKISDSFVPWSSINSSTFESQYYSIGLFIGIVIRTGLYQDLPFNPIVWKFLAGEEINDQDILSADPTLEDFFENVRLGYVKNGWTCSNWDESVYKLQKNFWKPKMGHTRIFSYILAISFILKN